MVVSLHQHCQILKPYNVLLHHFDLILLLQPLLNPLVIFGYGDMREEVVKGLLNFEHHHVVLGIYDSRDGYFIGSHCFYIILK